MARSSDYRARIMDGITGEHQFTPRGFVNRSLGGSPHQKFSASIIKAIISIQIDIGLSRRTHHTRYASLCVALASDRDNAS